MPRQRKNSKTPTLRVSGNQIVLNATTQRLLRDVNYVEIKVTNQGLIMSPMAEDAMPRQILGEGRFITCHERFGLKHGELLEGIVVGPAIQFRRGGMR